MPRTTFFWAVVILAVCAVGFSVASTLRQHPPVQNIVDKAEWTKKFSSHAANAYSEFRETYADSPFATQHKSAHVIGTLLYETQGLSGISICDGSFAFGCYHGYFGRAIAEKGASIIPALAQNCRERFGTMGTGCEHGIGHGIMEYTGRERLVEALELCRETHQAHELYGCTSGLFMEYNSSMMFRNGIAYANERPIDISNPLAPCNALVPSPFRTSCYFEIGLWWKGQLGAEYETIGNLCTKAETQAERDACYRGWGTVVAESVDHIPDHAKKTCDLIHEARGASVCLIGVVSRFFPAGYPEAARELCSELSGNFADECLKLTVSANDL